ncbi:SDR family oxidoreductase [Blastomonas sp.]|uniref:SDR family oxidoreductase n=1 Tax=Blastomonas sp. TaxID=1909299 RepID=UPI0035949174
MILLVGATGRLGQAVAQRLNRGGIPFRAACRTIGKSHRFAELGTEVVAMDIATGVGMVEALSGITKIVSCAHGLVGKSRHSILRTDVQGHAALIDAAAASGITRFVYLSALGASYDHPAEFWRAKAVTEKHLIASGLDYVILRPSAFMDLYAHDLIGSAVIRKRPVVLLGDGRLSRNMIAVEDVATVVVAACVRNDLVNETIEIGGPESLTEREIVAQYERLSGYKARVICVPKIALRAMASAIHPVHSGVARLLRLPIELQGRDDLHLQSMSWTERFSIVPMRLRDLADRKMSDR